MRSKLACGKSVTIYEQALGRSSRPITRLHSAVDVAFILYAEQTNGQTWLLYSAASCRTHLGDVYGLTVPADPPRNL